MTLATIVGVLLIVCVTATGLGICLYFKRKVHQNTAYTVKDIEGMYAKSLYREVACKVESLPSSYSRMGVSSMPSLPLGAGGDNSNFDGVTNDDIPIIPASLQHKDYSGMMLPGGYQPGGYQPGGYQPGNYNVVGGDEMSSRMVGSSMGGVSRPGSAVSRQDSGVSSTAPTEQQKMTESASTQVTSAKRTVVTVNLNMKEKENIKLNIFMNKDQLNTEQKEGEEEVKEEKSFPRGLTAKVSRKKSLERKSSAAAAAGKPPIKRNKSAESQRSPRPKSPVKERLSKKSSVKRKPSKS